MWSIDTDAHAPNEVVTSSWDNKVKVWDLNALDTSLSLDSTYTFKYHPAAILGLKCKDGLLHTGCYDKKIRIFDPRANTLVVEEAIHRRPIINIAVTDKYFLSGSEDKTVGVYDLRANKKLLQLQLDTPVLSMNVAVDVGFHYLRVGGKDGSFYLFDMSSDRFTLLDSMQLWSQHKVTQLCNFHGALAACSQDGSVRMYTPDRNMKFLHKFEFHSGEVASCHYRKGLFVTGSSDNEVMLWRVK